MALTFSSMSQSIILTLRMGGARLRCAGGGEDEDAGTVPAVSCAVVAAADDGIPAAVVPSSTNEAITWGTTSVDHLLLRRG